MKTLHYFIGGAATANKQFTIGNGRIVGGQIFALGLGTPNAADSLRTALIKGGQNYTLGTVDGNDNILMALTIGSLTTTGGAQGIWVPIDLRIRFPQTFTIEMVPGGGGALSWSIDYLLQLE